MRIRFLKDYEGYKRGDIASSKDDWETIQRLISDRIVQVVKSKDSQHPKKQIKHYSDKMMKTYKNK